MTKNQPTAEGFKRYMEASGHAPLASMTLCRAAYTSALMYERSPINTSGRDRKSRRRQ
jgi:hypothetical protein